MSPSTKRTSSGSCSMREGATRLSAVLAGVSLAASGIQTSHTAMARCSFHPYTHPCQPLLVQSASVSMDVWGTLAAFLSFLCHTPPFACKTVLSRATALPLLSQGLSISTRWRPRQPFLLRQALGQSLQTPLECAPGGETSLFREAIAHHAHLRSGLVEDRQELSHPMQPPYDHDYQSLQEELLRVNDGPSPAAARWRWARDALDETDQLDKDTLLSDHGCASGSSVLGHTPSSEASRSGASPDEVFYL